MVWLNAVKPIVVVGTIGHTGHGKSTLVAALAKIASDYHGPNLEDFDLATIGKSLTSTVAVHHRSSGRHYQQLDCEAEASAKCLIGHLGPLDGAILVCSAADGPTSQTREHLLLAHRIGVPYVVVFLSKADTVDDLESVDKIESDIRTLLTSCGFPGDETPIVRGSARLALDGDQSEIGAASVAALVAEMDRWIPEPERNAYRAFLLAVERVASTPTGGAQLTGWIEQGSVKVGDPVEVIGLKATRRCVIDSLDLSIGSITTGKTGDAVRVLLRDVKPEDVKRGQVLAEPGSITAHAGFEAEVYFLSKDASGNDVPPFRCDRAQFHFRTANVTGSAKLPEGLEKVMPGKNMQVGITLDAPIAMDEGLRFKIDDDGRAVGFGVVVKINS